MTEKNMPFALGGGGNHFRALHNDGELENLARLKNLYLGQLENFGNLWNVHSLIALRRQTLSRLLYYSHLYNLIIDVPGVIMEFGVQWGAGLVTLLNLRGIHEPFNFSRTIHGFDTFEGFPETSSLDGLARSGDNSTTRSYESVLEDLLAIHESFSPISHIKKFEVIKGDVHSTVPEWLERNQHSVISLAIFDLDLYAPTKDIMERVIGRMPKGAVIAFDELNHPSWPGETVALQEVIGLNNLRLRRFPHQPYCAYAIIGE
jgi:hypothetical protein